MKRLSILVLFILWLLSLTSCSPHWCNPNKTLNEAIEDCRKCDYDASIADFGSNLLRYAWFEKCMENKGYLLIDEHVLPLKFQKANVSRQSNVSFPLYRLGSTDSNFIRVAGK